MKRLSICLLFILLLSSCSMHTTKYSNQKLFYGESLIEIDGDEDNEIPNSTFIYSPDKPNRYEESHIIVR